MKYIFFSTVVVLGALIVFPYYAKGENNLLLASDVFVSSYNLAQADTFLVVVKNEPAKITGKLGSLKMHFLRNEDGKDWVAITGIAVGKIPGIYKLSINVPGKAPFKKNITVAKRKFPITKMVITPELLSKGYTAKKIINNIEKKENVDLNKVLDVFNPAPYFARPFIYPLDLIEVVGNFGDIRATKDYKIQHLGVDLKAPLNTNVYAVNNGQIVFAKSLPDYGNTIIIDHGLGVYSLYLHLAEFKAAEGQMVKQKDLVGLSGDSGYATGPHLHFAIKVRGAALDPLKFIQTTQATR